MENSQPHASCTLLVCNQNKGENGWLSVLHCEKQCTLGAASLLRDRDWSVRLSPQWTCVCIIPMQQQAGDREDGMASRAGYGWWMEHRARVLSWDCCEPG
mmetsp:Transcript_22022/g.57447  ORF Transcript_22022/g.57447 Transcript_22022/m.57447 type:complete len:100 (+) Transcript_22022:239-538(+)|eukprot:1152406-Pelagomonas_calceolata.AAC.3